MRRLIRTCLSLALALPLAACHLWGGGDTCNVRQPYDQAVSVPPLKVPEGLQAPTTRTALKIPDVQATAPKRGAKDACLDEPPSFYPGRPKPGLPATAPKKK